MSPKHGQGALRVFGFTALTIGLSLIVLIIWAELFGYR